MNVILFTAGMPFCRQSDSMTHSSTNGIHFIT